MTVTASQEVNARVMLVEGDDDLHAVEHIRRSAGIPELDIAAAGGIDRLLGAIEPTVQQPGREMVGIVADGNDEPALRWSEIREQFAALGIELPDAAHADGTVIDVAISSVTRIGIWLMPDNGEPGELEDFARAMIPGDDSVWPRARAYIAGIPARDRKFRAGKMLRAEVHAWLATREQPGRIGAAIGAGDLDTRRAALAALRGLAPRALRRGVSGGASRRASPVPPRPCAPATGPSPRSGAS